MRVDLDFFCAFAVAVSFRSMCQSLLLETFSLSLDREVFCERIFVHLSFFSVRDLLETWLSMIFLLQFSVLLVWQRNRFLCLHCSYGVEFSSRRCLLGL